MSTADSRRELCVAKAIEARESPAPGAFVARCIPVRALIRRAATDKALVDGTVPSLSKRGLIRWLVLIVSRVGLIRSG